MTNDGIDGDITQSDVVRAISALLELLHEERYHPESLASGHGYALKVAIAVMEDCLERGQRLSVVK